MVSRNILIAVLAVVLIAIVAGVAAYYYFIVTQPQVTTIYVASSWAMPGGNPA